MTQKIKTLIISLASFLVMAGSVAVPAVANAAAPVDPATGVCAGASTLQLGGNSANNNAPDGTKCNSSDQTSTVNNIITLILNILSVTVGIAAVVMIIIAGFRYVTSGGKDESVKGAKNTVLYAVIGLIVVALAQVIVKFVLNKATASQA